MGRRFQFVLAVVTLLCVVVIFLSPLVDLPYTALRSLRNAWLLPLMMLAAATALNLPLMVAARPLATLDREVPAAPGPALFELTCSRLC